MKIHLLILFFLIELNLFSAPFDTVLVQDNFTDRSKIKDLSLLLLWNNFSTPTTCFDIVDKSDNAGLTFKALVGKVANSISFTYAATDSLGRGTLKTHSAFDYELPIINRNNCTIKIEFDIIWRKLDDLKSNGGNYGENGRIVVALVNNYPSGGPVYNALNNTTTKYAFGNPIYNMRIRNPTPVNSGHADYVESSPTFLLYGGGHELEGEFEKSTSPLFWLPGFSSEAGGTSPGQPSSVDYPNSTVATKKSPKPWNWVASTTQWKHISWIIEPEVMKIYKRPSSLSSGYDTLVSIMSIPKDSFGTSYITNKINAIHSTSITQLPKDYYWGGKFNAIRFYNRAWRKNMAYFANVKVTKTYDKPTNLETNEIEDLSMVSIFPNPSNDGLIKIECKESNEYTIEIRSLTGQLIFKEDHIINSKQIDLSTNPRGLYFINIYNEFFSKTEKLIIN